MNFYRRWLHRFSTLTRVESKIDALTMEVQTMLPQMQQLIDNVAGLKTVDEGMRTVVTAAVATLNDMRQKLADLASQQQIDPADVQALADQVGAVSTDFQAQTDALVTATKTGTVAAGEPATGGTTGEGQPA